MLVVGICDGEQAVRSLLASYVQRFHAETGEEIRLLSYSTGEKMMKNYILELDLIFLEIPLRKMNGLMLAEYIRQQDTQVRIVFLTTVLSYVLEAYNVGASNYLLKPLGYSKFVQEVTQVLKQKWNKDSRCFLVQNKSGIYKIYFHEVRYLETSKKNILVHTEQATISSPKKMKQYEQLFCATSLVRCHAGFIVNLRYFHKLENSMVVLTDGTRIPVSRNRRKAVCAKIYECYGEHSVQVGHS